MHGRLLSSFQTSLDEITLIALPQQQAPAAKAVQIHSYVDPAKGMPSLACHCHSYQIAVSLAKQHLARHQALQSTDHVCMKVVARYSAQLTDNGRAQGW